jgi:hypothetical protein
MTLRLVTDDTRTIGTPEDKWRRLRNEVSFYRSYRDRVERETRRAQARNARRDGLFFIAGAATALYVIGVIALAGWVA